MGMVIFKEIGMRVMLESILLTLKFFSPLQAAYIINVFLFLVSKSVTLNYVTCLRKLCIIKK